MSEPTKNYNIDLSRDGSEGLARVLQKEMDDLKFRRPIRYTISDANGSVFSMVDDELEKVMSGRGRANARVKDLTPPLMIVCIDADGKELTASISREKPTPSENTVPPASHDA